MKVCTACLVSKSLDEFAPKKRYKFGRHSICRVCERAYKSDRRRSHGVHAKPKFLERIWNNIAICDHGIDCVYCCWPWLNYCGKNGYGSFTYRTSDGKQHHRTVTNVIYDLWHTIPLPQGKHAAHHCDNRPCGNPNHLFAASPLENVQDCVRKGRNAKGEHSGAYTKPEMVARGEKHGMARLTTVQVLAIRAKRAQGIPATQLSAEYDVSETHIYRITKEQNWKMIDVNVVSTF